MTVSEITNLGVIGAGQMGGGIARIAAERGYRVLLADVSLDAAQAGKDKIAKSLARGVAKGKVTQEHVDSTLDRLVPIPSLNELSEADFVVEAASENVELKLSLFEKLDGICGDGVILASNTSSISITRIGAATSRPEHVIGMHFMNPVPVMKLVEVIRGQETSDETTDAVMRASTALGKEPVEANDYPGFVSNRVLMPMINEAVFCLMEGVATKEGIDTVMKLGMAHPMGPLTLADLIGLDVCLDILEVLHRGLGDDKYRPCPLLRRMVAAGRLGRKSGKGFYDYE